MAGGDPRIPVLYLAPWLDIGGSDKGTLDWFRFLDRDRFRASLITTQPSPNRRLNEAAAYAEEVWALPQLLPGAEFPRFILSFIHTRQIAVVHIMNSRLGFELLPDMAALPTPPKVVVQLHVEEPDHSGYVRYVTSRYGNLIDAYSVSSRALADRLEIYEVPAAKRRVIYTGVDAQREFAPARVGDLPSLEAGPLHILYPARLVAQKDPLLMVEVARELRAAGVDFRLHSLGAGEMTDDVRAAIADAELQREVIFRGDVVNIAPWYAACDLVLLTSRWEGLPYVAFEAMAMARPLVAPRLAGLEELVTPEVGMLVAPRDDPFAYAEAIAQLAQNPARRRRIGDLGRAYVLQSHSLERMAAEHTRLYTELLDRHRAEGPPADERGELRRATLRLRNRVPGDRPLVSVVIPCYDHGRYLPACLQSVTAQGYAPIETIVVDNASTDPETLVVLASTAKTGPRVITMEDNRGPGAARNAGVDAARGRYVLFLDADNVLLPGSIEALLKQLAAAGEQVGFIYPNYRFFGNRNDRYEVPSYNLDALLDENYCDVCSLFDSEIFGQGLRFADDLAVGYEDWDFVLALAERGIHGEPARQRTFLSRKHGFTRSDLVDATTIPRDEMLRRHPALYAARQAGKPQWSPALTVIALDPLAGDEAEGWRQLVAAVWRQSCGDLEMIVQADSDPPPRPRSIVLRSLPAAMVPSRAAALVRGARIARGRIVLAAYGSPSAMLENRALAEKVLRSFASGAEVLALADAGSDQPSFSRLDAEAVSAATLGALAWRASAGLPAAFRLDGERPLELLARWHSARAALAWRQLGRSDRAAVARRRGGPAATAVPWPPPRWRDLRIRDRTPPILPDLHEAAPPRVRQGGPWVPPQSRLLYRHWNPATGRYLLSNHRDAPPGHTLQHVLGSVRALPLPGTLTLSVHGSAFRLGALLPIDAPELLGFSEQAPLPMFEPLFLARHRDSGQSVLLGGENDPLHPHVQDARGIGWVEPYPVAPPLRPQPASGYGLVGLLRTVDTGERRHRYGAGAVPPGELTGELGALFSEPTGPCEPVWIDDFDRVQTRRLERGLASSPSVSQTLRWVGAPLRWQHAGPVLPRLRASARRSLDAGRPWRGERSGRAKLPEAPIGYMSSAPGPSTVPLYAAYHPVTGDQLLSTRRRAGPDLGYSEPVLLGHLVAQAPLTGRLGPQPGAIPWASRFGQISEPV